VLHPRLYVLIGRSSSFRDSVEKRRLFAIIEAKL